MKVVSYADAATGLFSPLRSYASDEAAIAANTPPGHIAVEGEHDHLSSRLDLSTGQVIDYKPPAPSPEHQWDEIGKRWRLSEAALAAEAAQVEAQCTIASAEAAQARAVREFLLGDPTALTRLQALNQTVIGARSKLKPAP